jgi:hypothetical protein
MWLSLTIIFSFGLFFWLSMETTDEEKAEEKDDRDTEPLAALYFTGFWEED